MKKEDEDNEKSVTRETDRSIERDVPGVRHGPYRRVLVVDDNVDAADSLARLLRLMGHQVWLSLDGLSAIETARRVTPDLLLLDLSMPGMSGFEVASRVREDQRLAGLRIVAVTGFGQEETRELARESGFDAYVVKPVEPSHLEHLLGFQA
jgi:CheY-like chemotaxis protein